MRVTLIDNYDSFTFNLVHYLGELGADVTVCATTRSRVERRSTRSPTRSCSRPALARPTKPASASNLVRAAGATMPILGVCLGHQAIGQAFGGEVVRAPVPMHGKISHRFAQARGLFRGVNGPFQATRYHSLVVRAATAPDDLEVTAEADDGLIMGVSHATFPCMACSFIPKASRASTGARS